MQTPKHRRAERKRKLLKWSAGLRDIVAPIVTEAPARFNMEYWSTDPGDPDRVEGEHKTLPAVIMPTCFAAGCAAGWATYLFRFSRKLQLRLKGTMIELHRDGHPSAIRDEEGAVAAFFDITLPHAEEITLPDRYFQRETYGESITPDQVADRIDQILEEINSTSNYPGYEYHASLCS